MDMDWRTLGRSPLFSALTKLQLEQVQKHARVLQFGAGEVLFHHKDPAKRFYFLREGQIKLFRVSANGMEKIMELIVAGEFFATAVMFMEGRTYPVSAETLSKCQVYGFENRVFLDVLRESPETCFRIMGEMSRRLRNQVVEIDTLSMQSASSRLAIYLLNQMEGNVITLGAPKRIVAARLSIQPETFSRIFRTLKSKSVIEERGRIIQVLDHEALQAFAEGQG
ncbi:MAG: Crp/Fnr family transcriptional regulator [Magnetococcales bacterium]|nr:Crp/Fnr family transcriptional regulator [Magnetococcales bacterium]